MTTVTGNSPISYRSIIVLTAISVLYLLLSARLIGFKTDQVFVALLFNLLYYASNATRQFILGFSVFIIFWILFDSMKAFPNYRFNTVHIQDIYRFEKAVFGMHAEDGHVITPNEYWISHGNTPLDVLAGIFYLCWIPLPLAFGIYLFYNDRSAYFNFSLSFLLINLLGFIVYYAYPAAPPWYVQQYGFGFEPHTPGNTAGLARFDQFVHIPVFSSLYSKSSNVFAAMPSLHASYPLVVFYFGLRKRMYFASIFFGIITLGIWFTAVYSSHHYVLDVLAGITCGITGIALYAFLMSKSVLFNRFVKAWEGLTISRSRQPSGQ